MRTFRNNPGFLIDFPAVLNEVFGNEIVKNNFTDSFRPAVNITENEVAYSVALVAPGFNKEDFSIKAEGKKLIISGNIKEDKEINYSLREFIRQSFTRTFSLPENKINEDEIKAAYENGILLLTLPKKEEAKAKAPKQIEIL